MSKVFKILILEDNSSDADLLIRELKKTSQNFDFKAVHNRTSYEIALKDFAPNLILSDFNLPAFDGLSAFFLKQKIIPEVPFLIVSGAIGEEKAVELIKNGVTDYVPKDKLFTLSQKIDRALKEAEEKHKKKIAEEKITLQNQKLLEISNLQSHQIRRPVSNILGLIQMFNTDNPADNSNLEILEKLEIAAKDLDNIIREIVVKTENI